MPFAVGANVFNHSFDSGANKSIDQSLKISEFPGIGCFVTNRVRLGLNFQFTEQVTPVPGDNMNAFGLLPQINYNFWGPLTASVVPSFYPVFDGISQFAFAVQGVLTYAHAMREGFLATASVEVPVFLKPTASIGITPLVGVVYRIP